MTQKRKHEKRPANGLTSYMVIRVNHSLKARYEAIAKQRTQPHQKVTSSDVARDALCQFLNRAEKAA